MSSVTRDKALTNVGTRGGCGRVLALASSSVRVPPQVGTSVVALNDPKFDRIVLMLVFLGNWISHEAQDRTAVSGVIVVVASPVEIQSGDMIWDQAIASKSRYRSSSGRNGNRSEERPRSREKYSIPPNRKGGIVKSVFRQMEHVVPWKICYMEDGMDQSHVF